MLRRLMAFGLVSVLGTVLWNVNSHISFYLVSSNPGMPKSDAGVFFAFMRLGSPVLLLAQAAWAVLFVHVARRWESGRREDAIGVLETAYKGIALALMTLAVIIYATSPYWVLVLKSDYRQGLGLVGPLMMSFLSVAFMALMATVARLHERPVVIAVAGVVSGTLTAVLAVFWMERHGLCGAAYASGVGMFLGIGVVSGLYLVTARTRLHWSTIAVLGLPAILLAPRWAAAVGWAAALAAIVFTPIVFTRRQKRSLLEGLRHLTRLGGRNGA